MTHVAALRATFQKPAIMEQAIALRGKGTADPIVLAAATVELPVSRFSFLRRLSLPLERPLYGWQRHLPMRHTGADWSDSADNAACSAVALR